MNLSIITVTWNNEDLVAEQIRSVVSGCVGLEYEQIIVDNGSSDKTTEVVEQQFPHVTLIKNPDNKGFAAANNQAVKIAKGTHILFLNADMRVEPGSIDKMLTWMKQDPNIGLASCKLVDEHGNVNADAQPRRFPELLDQAALILKIPHIFPFVMNRYLMKGFDADKEQQVDSVRGSFMLIKRDIVDTLGWGFDPRYFIWFEDADLCREVRRLGFKVVHTPIITCVDYVGQSFKKQPNMWKQKMFTCSMVTYFKKWEPWYKWMTIAALRPVGIGLMWLRVRFTKVK